MCFCCNATEAFRAFQCCSACQELTAHVICGRLLAHCTAKQPTVAGAVQQPQAAPQNSSEVFHCAMLASPNLRRVLYATAGTRSYHNLEHVMSVFDFVSFCTKAGVVLQDPAAIDWAVWFHDIIYDPRRCAGRLGALSRTFVMPVGQG